MSYVLAASAEMLFTELPFVERVRAIHDRGLGVEIWNWTTKDLDELAATSANFTSMTGYIEGDLLETDGIARFLETAEQSIVASRIIDADRLNVHGTGLDGDGQAIPGVPYDAILRRSGSLLVKLAPRAAGVDAAGRTCMQARRSLQITAAQSAEPADVADDGAEPDAQWACPQCTLLNPAPAPVCRLCDFKVKVHDDNGPTLKRLAAGRESEARKEHGEEVAKRSRTPAHRPQPICPSRGPLESLWGPRRSFGAHPA